MAAIAWTVCLAIMLWVWISPSAFGQDSSNSSGSLLTTNSPFVLYLQNPPWIKKLVFVENVFNEAGPTPEHITLRAWVNETNVVAIQPSGMYLIRLTPNPAGFGPPASPKQLVVQGVADSYFWQASRDLHYLALSSKLPQAGGTESNNLQRLWKMFLQWDINPVRYFGFPPLRPGSFCLGGSNQFAAVTEDGQDVAGEILSASNNRPTRLKYFIGSDIDNPVSLIYQYGPGDALPNYFVRLDPGNPYPHRRERTNWILTASYGIDTNVQKGYTPAMFFSNSGDFSRILIQSNGERYLVTSNGLSLVPDKYVPPPFLPHQHSEMVTVVILMIFLAGSGLFVWKVARSREISKQQPRK